MSETRLVFFVHGTFSGPETWKGMPEIIVAEAAKLGLNVNCECFPWKPALNSHRTRYRAALDLSDRVREVTSALALVPRRSEVLLIGHSHGGTVCLYAKKILEREGVSCRVVTIATPFIRLTLPSISPEWLHNSTKLGSSLLALFLFSGLSVVLNEISSTYAPILIFVIFMVYLLQDRYKVFAEQMSPQNLTDELATLYDQMAYPVADTQSVHCFYSSRDEVSVILGDFSNYLVSFLIFFAHLIYKLAESFMNRLKIDKALKKIAMIAAIVVFVTGSSQAYFQFLLTLGQVLIYGGVFVFSTFFALLLLGDIAARRFWGLAQVTAAVSYDVTVTATPPNRLNYCVNDMARAPILARILKGDLSLVHSSIHTSKEFEVALLPLALERPD
jgi:hypothetical protein